MNRLLMILLLLPLIATGARADAIDETFARHAAAGTYGPGAAEIAGLAAADPARAGAAEGAMRFALAIEHLGQGLYRYGLAPPSSRETMVLPVLRYPVPDNPAPQQITYQDFRHILESLVADLDAADRALARLGNSDVKLPVDLARLAIDFNADGRTTPEETLGGSLARMMGAMPEPGTMPDMTVAFDTADIYWMRGYSRFVSGFAQFLLAHDFEPLFDKTFHLFFPRGGLATGDQLARNRSVAPYVDGEIGDLIAFVHLLNWPVTDSARLADVRMRLLGMAEMSKLSWAAARRETDDDREWLPTARQTGAMTGASLADETIDGWLTVMDEFTAILEGRKLMPHWRFDRGMNVKRMFAEQKTFDLVLLITGTDAAAYLEDGPVSTSAEWNRIMAVFQGNFLGYALWFN
jgi:hypothetical protein